MASGSQENVASVSGRTDNVASSSGAVEVIPKFDMHIYTSVMSEGDVREAARVYGIPEDLHPRLPPPGMTMERVPRNAIGLYEAYFEFSGIRVPFSTFLLQVLNHFRVHISQLVPIGLTKVILFEVYCRSLNFAPYVTLFRLFYMLQKQGHWFSFARRTGKNGPARIFNETCSSLKHWKDRFFLIDRRAIPQAMPWRHADSSVSELPPAGGYQLEHVDALTAAVVDIQALHPALLFEAGLSKLWKYPGHRPVFKDGEGNGNSLCCQSSVLYCSLCACYVVLIFVLFVQLCRCLASLGSPTLHSPASVRVRH